MRPMMLLLAATLLAGTAGAGDVYVSRDAKGNVIYTDTPQTVPAQKLEIRSSSTDPAQAQARYDEQMKQYAADDAGTAQPAASTAGAKKAAAPSAEERAKRCAQARQRYDASMQSFHLYVVGPDGERRYLDSSEIDATRADAKKVMDELCSGQ